MAWELLPVNYTDATWSGLKRYTEIQNGDGTVSFQDVTVYSQKENSFFGAKEANRMNEALNTLMSMVESGTDLYTAFQNYSTRRRACLRTPQTLHRLVSPPILQSWKLRVTVSLRPSKRITAMRSPPLKTSRNSYSTLGLSLSRASSVTMWRETCKTRLICSM